MLFHFGDLSVADRAGVNNWFHTRIPNASKPAQKIKWFQELPIVHARTLLLAYRILQERKNHGISAGSTDLKTVLGLAWTKQLTATPQKTGADVDKEAIARLEERMFEHSLASGKAGNEQWGLDAGSHQEHWSPYFGLPSEWSHDDRQDWSESEFLVRLSFSVTCE